MVFFEIVQIKMCFFLLLFQSNIIKYSSYVLLKHEDYFHLKSKIEETKKKY